MKESPENLKVSSVESHIPSEEGYISIALENLQNTSRTAGGIVDVSASPDKAAKIAEGLSSESAASRALENFKRAVEYAYEHRDEEFADTDEIRGFVEHLVQMINNGIVAHGILIREGQDSPKYPYTRIEKLGEAMAEFYETLLATLDDEAVDPRELAAWIEYRIDLTDHFFADGCGKAAKAISAWILMRRGYKFPHYRGREDLYDHAPKNVRGIDPEVEQRQYAIWADYHRTLFDA